MKVAIQKNDILFIKGKNIIILITMSYFSLILARLPNGGIGYKGKLPWHYSSELKHFKKVTTQDVDGHPNNLIMGRLTWNSLHYPLPGRRNIVISSKSKEELGITHPDVLVYSQLSLALQDCKKGKTFVIGGKSLYEEAVKSPYLESIYETSINSITNYQCDVYFRELFGITYGPLKTKLVQETREDIDSDYLIFRKYYVLRSHGEEGYLDLLREVITKKNLRKNRTGVLTHSVFGRMLKFDLSQGFPLFTTKQVFIRGIFEELMWLIRGQTDTAILAAKKVHIWDGNTTREFLDSLGLTHLPVGDIGKGYGHQWRRFGADYDNCHNLLPGGIDQLKYVLNLLQTNPYDRRILVTAWNPCDLDIVALPPCHLLYQFYVDEDEKRLSCMFYMRSCDLFHGLPFNIASYSLLTHMIAKICGYGVGEVIAVLGDTHIYSSHDKEVIEQLDRPVRNLPQLIITKPITNLEEMEALEFTDLKIEGYQPHGKISVPMVV